MQEKDGVHRREEIGHVAIRPWIDRSHAANVVVDFVVWKTFQDREFGRGARLRVVRRSPRTREAYEVLGVIKICREQARVDHERRDVVSGLIIKLGIAVRKIPGAATDRESLIARNACVRGWAEPGHVIPEVAKRFV